MQPGHKYSPLPKGEAAGKELSEPICPMLGLVLHSRGGGAGWCFTILLTPVLARSKRCFVSLGMSWSEKFLLERSNLLFCC